MNYEKFINKNSVCIPQGVYMKIFNKYPQAILLFEYYLYKSFIENSDNIYSESDITKKSLVWGSKRLKRARDVLRDL